VKHQLSKSAEPPRGGEAQKLSEGRRRVPPPEDKTTRRLGLKNTSRLVGLHAAADEKRVTVQMLIRPAAVDRRAGL
jgi:hypothetical protein